jgi:hypothetical protein
VQGQTGCKNVILAEKPSLHATVKFTGGTLHNIQLHEVIKLDVLYTIMHLRFIQLRLEWCLGCFKVSAILFFFGFSK